jgi:hypothetical protein
MQLTPAQVATVVFGLIGGLAVSIKGCVAASFSVLYGKVRGSGCGGTGVGAP